MTLLDYVNPIPVSVLKANNVSYVSRYLCPFSGDTLNKRIKQPEYNGLVTGGIGVLLNWEHAATDWMGGESAGRSHAQQAVAQADALGYPLGSPIIGSCDFNISLTQWSDHAEAYAKAFRAVVQASGYAVGGYGHFDLLQWCADIGYNFFWQTMSTSWANGRNAHLNPLTNVWQKSTGHIDGGRYSVDFNTIINLAHSGPGSSIPELPIKGDGMLYQVGPGLYAPTIFGPVLLNYTGEYASIQGSPTILPVTAERLALLCPDIRTALTSAVSAEAVAAAIIAQLKG